MLCLPRCGAISGDYQSCSSERGSRRAEGTTRTGRHARMDEMVSEHSLRNVDGRPRVFDRLLVPGSDQSSKLFRCEEREAPGRLGSGFQASPAKADRTRQAEAVDFARPGVEKSLDATRMSGCATSSTLVCRGDCITTEISKSPNWGWTYPSPARHLLEFLRHKAH